MQKRHWRQSEAREVRIKLVRCCTWRILCFSSTSWEGVADGGTWRWDGRKNEMAFARKIFTLSLETFETWGKETAKKCFLSAEDFRQIFKWFACSLDRFLFLKYIYYFTVGMKQKLSQSFIPYSDVRVKRFVSPLGPQNYRNVLTNYNLSH